MKNKLICLLLLMVSAVSAMKRKAITLEENAADTSAPESELFIQDIEELDLPLHEQKILHDFSQEVQQTYPSQMSWADQSKRALHHAAGLGQEKVAKLFLKYNAYINGEDNQGVAPLRYAIRAAGDDTSMITLLVTHGADIEQNIYGFPPLLYALTTPNGYEKADCLITLGVKKLTRTDYQRVMSFFTQAFKNIQGPVGMSVALMVEEVRSVFHDEEFAPYRNYQSDVSPNQFIYHVTSLSEQEINQGQVMDILMVDSDEENEESDTN